MPHEPASGGKCKQNKKKKQINENTKTAITKPQHSQVVLAKCSRISLSLLEILLAK